MNACEAISLFDLDLPCIIRLKKMPKKSNKWGGRGNMRGNEDKAYFGEYHLRLCDPSLRWFGRVIEWTHDIRSAPPTCVSDVLIISPAFNFPCLFAASYCYVREAINFTRKKMNKMDTHWDGIQRCVVLRTWIMCIHVVSRTWIKNVGGAIYKKINCLRKKNHVELIRE